jgi:hypothetical protein
MRELLGSTLNLSSSQVFLLTAGSNPTLSAEGFSVPQRTAGLTTSANLGLLWKIAQLRLGDLIP